MKAEIGHYCHHDRLAGQHLPARQIGREQGHQAVAVDQIASGVDGDDAVGVAIEGQPEVGPFRFDRLDEPAGVSGTAFVVDVRAVGLDGQHGDKLCASRLEHCRCALESRSVGAVKRHPQAVQAPPLQAREQVPLVAPQRVRVRRDLPDSGAGGRPGPLWLGEQRRQLRLECLLGLTGQLGASGGEELDTVVPERVVRGGDDRRRRLLLRRQVGDGGRGDDARIDNVYALARQPGREGRLQQRAREAGVAADDEPPVAAGGKLNDGGPRIRRPPGGPEGPPFGLFGPGAPVLGPES